MALLLACDVRVDRSKLSERPHESCFPDIANNTSFELQLLYFRRKLLKRTDRDSRRKLCVASLPRSFETLVCTQSAN